MKKKSLKKTVKGCFAPLSAEPFVTIFNVDTGNYNIFLRSGKQLLAVNGDFGNLRDCNGKMFIEHFTENLNTFFVNYLP